jgi:hypothetical protein
MDGVDKSFEARIFATLDQHQAALKALHLQGMGILLAVALAGVGIALIGKELAK